MKMSECVETNEGVRSLMAKDQLFFTLPRDVQTHVKELDRQDLPTMVKNASNYIDAHNLQ